MRLALTFAAGLFVGGLLVVAAGEWFAMRRAHRDDSWMRDIHAAQIVKRTLS